MVISDAAVLHERNFAAVADIAEPLLVGDGLIVRYSVTLCECHEPEVGVTQELWQLDTPDEFAELVWKKIISAKHLKATYLIGPKVAVLPWIHRLLPEQQVQNVWARMFKQKRRR